MIGIPIGAILSKHSIHTPLYASISLCILNCLLIPLLPTYQEPLQTNKSTSITTTSTIKETTSDKNCETYNIY